MGNLTQKQIDELKRKAKENGIELETRGERIVRMLREKEDKDKPRFRGVPI